MSYSRRKTALRWKATYNKAASAASKTGSDLRFDELDLDYIWPGLAIVDEPFEDSLE
jgi:hypothetical protein